MLPPEGSAPAGRRPADDLVRPSQNQLKRAREFANGSYGRLLREGNWFLRGRHWLIVLGLALSFASAAAALVVDKDVYRILGGLLSLGSGVVTASGKLITPRKAAAKYAQSNAWRRLRDDYDDLLEHIDDESRLPTAIAAARYQELREAGAALEDAETSEFGGESADVPSLER